MDVAAKEQRRTGVPQVVEADDGNFARFRSDSNDRLRRLLGLMRVPIPVVNTRPLSW